MHRIADISFALNTITCTCSAIVSTGPPQGGRSWPPNDPHQPLVDGWNAHLFAVSGAPVMKRTAAGRFWEAA